MRYRLIHALCTSLYSVNHCAVYITVVEHHCTVYITTVVHHSVPVVHHYGCRLHHCTVYITSTVVHHSVPVVHHYGCTSQCASCTSLRLYITVQRTSLRLYIRVCQLYITRGVTSTQFFSLSKSKSSSNQNYSSKSKSTDSKKLLK